MESDAGYKEDAYKNRDIEILRAAAIFFVLFFHWAPHALNRFGQLGDRFLNVTALWSGVDLFFCISGFVIASSLLREFDRAPHRAGFQAFAFPFWIRRMWRLWPSAWLWILVSVVLAYCLNSSGLFGVPRNTVRDGVMAFLNLYNIHYYLCLREQSCGSLSVYWSLSLEEQFYFIFPFLLFFLRRRTLVLVLISAALLQCLIPRPIEVDSNAPSLLWLLRTAAICFGILIALWRGSASYERMKPVALERWPLRMLVTGLLLGMLAVVAAPNLALTRATGVLAVVSAILVWIASYRADFIFPRVASLEPVLSWLGSRSYSLYLIHTPLAFLSGELRARMPDSGSVAIGSALSALFTIGSTLALSEWNYRFVELPLRRVGRNLARKEHAELALPTTSIESIT
jgi:peptidoglycan/LPS O-acetylase OafA/YrhL